MSKHDKAMYAVAEAELNMTPSVLKLTDKEKEEIRKEIQDFKSSN